MDGSARGRSSIMHSSITLGSTRAATVLPPKATSGCIGVCRDYSHLVVSFSAVAGTRPMPAIIIRALAGRDVPRPRRRRCRDLDRVRLCTLARICLITDEAVPALSAGADLDCSVADGNRIRPIVLVKQVQSGQVRSRRPSSRLSATLTHRKNPPIARRVFIRVA